MHLAINHIYLRPIYEEFLEDITRLISHVYKDRDSPGLLLD
jgi:hypothetical protein